MKLIVNNNEFVDIQCRCQSEFGPKKECSVYYGKIKEYKIIEGYFSSDFEEVLKMLGFSPYQIKALIDYLYENEAKLSIMQIHLKMKYSIEDRITKEQLISSDNVPELFNRMMNKENNASL